jgi:hypothetical protein
MDEILRIRYGKNMWPSITGQLFLKAVQMLANGTPRWYEFTEIWLHILTLWYRIQSPNLFHTFYTPWNNSVQINMNFLQKNVDIGVVPCSPSVHHIRCEKLASLLLPLNTITSYYVYSISYGNKGDASSVSNADFYDILKVARSYCDTLNHCQPSAV